MTYERFLNKSKKPKQEEILKAIGENVSLWEGIHKYIEENYDFTKEIKFFTKKYGWTIRYKKKTRTMVYFFPEFGAFSSLIVLGKKESEEMDKLKDKLSDTARMAFENTEQLHDGRWLWIRALTEPDVRSIKLLLSMKRKPKNELIIEGE